MCIKMFQRSRNCGQGLREALPQGTLLHKKQPGVCDKASLRVSELRYAASKHSHLHVHEYQLDILLLLSI